MYQKYAHHLTTAILRVRREPLCWHVSHLIRPRDPQVAQGSLPLPSHFAHLHMT